MIINSEILDKLIEGEIDEKNDLSKGNVVSPNNEELFIEYINGLKEIEKEIFGENIDQNFNDLFNEPKISEKPLLKVICNYKNE